jgi:hypothetical protein
LKTAKTPKFFHVHVILIKIELLFSQKTLQCPKHVVMQFVFPDKEGIHSFHWFSLQPSIVSSYLAARIRQRLFVEW